MNTYQTGLVLGGGGARGFAHLGVAKALKESGIKIDIISGVSAGAIAGSFLASGMDPDEIFKLLSQQDFMKITKFRLTKQGFIRLEGLKQQIRANIPYKNIEDLPTPLIVAACNLNKAKVVYFRKGPLADLVIASSSIPVLFSPVKIGGQIFVDGGVLDNLPVKPIRRHCEKVIAVNISPIHDTDKLDTLMQIATRVFHVSVDKSTVRSGKQADLYVEPPGVENYEILRSRYSDELFHIAYDHTKKLLKEGF